MPTPIRTSIRIAGRLAAAVALLLAVCAGILLLGQRPSVPESAPLTQSERAWASSWLRTAKPRGMQEGQRAILSLTEPEANLLARYLLDRVGDGRARIRFEPGRALAAVSLPLPWGSSERFLNLEIGVAGAELSPGAAPADIPPGLPKVSSARLAGLPLPSGLAQRLAERALGALDRTGVLQGIAIESGRIRVLYEWHSSAAERIAGGLVSPEELERLLHYQDLAARWGAKQPKGKGVGLADLLSHLIAEAGSAGQDRDPTVENRAAIVALAAYVNRRRIRDPEPPEPAAKTAATRKPPPYRRVSLRGREDLAKHFMTSAALAAQGGNAISDLMGLFKEISDSRGGSGFSFPDLTADRAGTRFGELATARPSGARAVQELARRGLREDDFMPAITGLPEGLGAEDFAATFGDPSSPAYRRLIDHIERRIDQRTLFRSSEG